MTTCSPTRGIVVTILPPPYAKPSCKPLITLGVIFMRYAVPYTPPPIFLAPSFRGSNRNVFRAFCFASSKASLMGTLASASAVLIWCDVLEPG
ncbi:hypothetical protein FR483_n723R [Paramecium bursaria Chlorella virus FR483]|uniref:Uncharacterized protein n723R n=1 Tax=Paramecium bursaria Chlorella virus FR483 TaxID=399781 RepID=A7J877_PBCVF|nr:hypothetical protein FR483_n723R [Paramecium bursaria Chlorella virus FR483]ABT16008.1 hypothetical protein FR483_n723R [Paramecium bursaria Chlorella virus FR483]